GYVAHAIAVLVFIHDSIDLPDLVSLLDLWQTQSFQSRAEHRRQVGMHPLVPDGVDPHVAQRMSARWRVLRDGPQRASDGLSRGVLLGRWHAVLDIQEQHVRRRS